MRLFVASLAAFLWASTPSGWASLPEQNGAPANPQGGPESPLDLLESAGRASGFVAPDMAPWHLRATYNVLNAVGQTTSTGTYEIFWAGAKKIKQSYASNEFSQTDYLTESGLLRSGDMDWPMIKEQRVPNSLFIHIFPHEMLKNLNLIVNQKAIAGATLRCIALQSKATPGSSLNNAPTYCIELATPLLRYASGMGSNVIEQQSGTLFNGFVPFRGHAVSRDLTVAYKDRPCLKIRVDVLEDLTVASDDLFRAPGNAAAPPAKRRYIDQPHMEGKITHKSAPAFGFPDATSAAVPGMLDVIVGKDGSVKTVRPIMGPILFEQSEIHSVQKTKYQPTLVDGQPVEVETEVGYMLTTQTR